MIETFWSHKRYKWFKRSAAALGLAVLFFALNAPVGGRNGGTFYGYALGVISAAGIFYLTWYGMRKRSYKNFSSTLQECLSAHVWIGISLLVLVPLHSGFEFGWNVHALAYLLLVLVVGSGIWGALNYQIYAREVPSHRGGKKMPDLLAQVAERSRAVSVARSGLGAAEQQLVSRLDCSGEPRALRAMFVAEFRRLTPEEISGALAEVPAAAREKFLAVIELLQAKRGALAELEAELAVQARLKLWLYLHVPLTVGLWAALLIHIVSVFYRW